MPSRTVTLFSAGLLFVAVVCHVAFGSSANDDRTTMHGITVAANAEDTASLPDFDGDGTVGFGDFVKFAAKFGLGQGDDGFDAQFDLNGDGEIGFADFLILAENFGKEIPADDRAALVALYKATDGANWTNSTNWLSDRPLYEWHGVLDDANGRVSNLELRNNNLTGEMPVELAQLSKLQWLDLAENHLTGSIPTGVGRLSNLERLYLTRNQLTGTIPTELGRLSKLRWLSLEINQLTGTIPVELARLSNLESLGLGPNQLTGTIPVELAGLSKLVTLSLSYNQLTGTIPVELAGLPNLESLFLDANQLTEAIPAELGQLSNLVTLVLGKNQLTGTIPVELAGLSNLQVLVLPENQLTGSIPTELAQLSNLNWLDLAFNQLTGAIPAELGRLSKLKYLALGPNYLTGTIPIQLGQLSGLTHLYLAFNQLTGAIPAELGRLSNLQYLELHSNQLTGAIPAELGQLSNLRSLFLGVNQLTGAFPNQLGRLTNLRHLALDGNGGLSGPLPEAFADLALEILDLGSTSVCVPRTGEFEQWLDGIDTSIGASHCSTPEREALIALYEQTDGTNWKSRYNWSTLAPLGEWFGVTTDAEGRVTHLDLRDNNLSGFLPPALRSLASLKRLTLAANPALSGPLPEGLSRLSLESLEMEGTSLCSPPGADFQAWLNRLSDSQVDRCTDARPDYYSLVEFYNATEGRNWKIATNWTSAAPLAEWHGVTTDGDGRVTGLVLNENSLRGTIPAELGRLASLENLSLRNNNLTGKIPGELGRVTNLRDLDLGENDLTGKIPPELGQLAKLQRLQLYRNNLTGEVPKELRQLTNLTELNLGGNPLIGNIPPELGQLTNLQRLQLWGNNLTGGVPPEMGRLSSLGSLVLFNNNLAGDIPPELGQLTNLEYLDLTNNNLTGETPSELGQLTKLQVLNLSGNQLSGNIPPELGQLESVESLFLVNNNLTGSIPAELGQLSNLRELNLSTNQLSGNVPPELGELTNLRELNLSTNQLSGDIPPDLGQLENLEILYFINNNLTGNIPPELGQLTELRELNLSTNQLSGNIPPELGQLTNLKALRLTFNRTMSGALPSALTGLTLETLQLQETLLCSPQDAAFQQWMSTISFARVPNCARSNEAAAYLVQATQSLEYPVPLVAGEAALLRVFVTADGEVDATMPPVRAIFYRDGVEVHTANIGGQTTNIPRQVNEASLLNSANAVVPGSVVMPGLEMVVEIDPDQSLDAALGVGARLPPTGRTALDVRSVPPFELTLIPLLWEEHPDRSVLAQTEGLSAESDLFRLTRDLLPVREFRLKVHEPVMISLDPTGEICKGIRPEMELVYAMEGAKGHYMGVIRAVGRGVAGIGELGGFLSMAILHEEVIAHELGHNLNLGHAPGCGAFTPDPYYPTEDGSIGAWGYDFVNEALVNPATSDLMAYCEPRWISDYSFARALAYRSRIGSSPVAAGKPLSSKGLLLWGGLSENNELFLEPAFAVSAPPSLPRIEGPYTLTGEDEHGDNLFSLPFGMPEYGCGAKGGAFAFILPVSDDWAGRLARITLEGPEGVSILDGEDDPSAALLLDRAAGDVRGILRDWPEAAAKRPAASLGLTETGLEVLTSHGIPDAASWQR